MLMKRLLLVGCACVATISSARAQAGGEAQANGPGIEDIVVTARRVSENLQTTPVSMTALSAQGLERQQITNVERLQYTTPNLSMSVARDGDPTGINIGIRGQVITDAIFTNDPAVGVYFDGVYIARATGALINLVDVQRVEVLRGPQGTLFGRNTTGGAISIIPVQPTNRFEGSARLRLGNYAFREATAIVNLPVIDNAVSARFAYQHAERGGFGRSLITGQELGSYKTDFVRGSLRIAPAGSALELILSGDYTNVKSTGSNNRLISLLPMAADFSGGLANAMPGVCSAAAGSPYCPAGTSSVGQSLGGGFYDNYAGLRQFSNSEVWGVGGTLTLDLGFATLKSITAYRNVERLLNADLDGTPYTILEPRNPFHQHQISEEVQLLGKAFEDRLDWIIGYYFFREDGSDGGTTNSLIPLTPNANVIDVRLMNRSNAVYGQVSYKILEGLRINAGIRYTKDDRRYDGTNYKLNLFDGTTACNFETALLTNPALCRLSRNASFDYISFVAGVDYQLSRAAFLYAKVSRASRSGGINLRGVDTVSLKPFSPERLTSYEAGAKLDLFDRRLRFNLAGYYGDYANIQRPTVRIFNGTLTNFVVNAAKARIWGLELETVVKPADNFTISGALGVTQPKYNSFVDPFSGADRSGNPFIAVPKYTASASFDYSIPLTGGDLALHGDYGYRSSQYFDVAETSRQAGYGIANASATFRIDDPKVEFSLWVRNLTDKQYFSVIQDLTGTALGYAAGVPGEPRTWGISMGYNF